MPCGGTGTATECGTDGGLVRQGLTGAEGLVGAVGAVAVAVADGGGRLAAPIGALEVPRGAAAAALVAEVAAVVAAVAALGVGHAAPPGATELALRAPRAAAWGATAGTPQWGIETGVGGTEPPVGYGPHSGTLTVGQKCLEESTQGAAPWAQSPEDGAQGPSLWGTDP